MTVLTSTTDILAYLEEGVLNKLASRKRSRLTAGILMAVDRALSIVPYPIRKKIASLLWLDNRSFWGAVGSVQFWVVSLVTSAFLLACVLLMSVLLERILVFRHVYMLAPPMFAMVSIVILWSNVWRSISPGEASATQVFCSTPERAKIVSEWIAKWGGLRSMDAYFVHCLTEDFKRKSGMLHDALEQSSDSRVIIDEKRVPWSTQTIEFTKNALRQMYGANTKSKAAVEKILHQGELGKQLDHAHLEHDTPQATATASKPRL